MMTNAIVARIKLLIGPAADTQMFAFVLSRHNQRIRLHRLCPSEQRYAEKGTEQRKDNSSDRVYVRNGIERNAPLQATRVVSEFF